MRAANQPKAVKIYKNSPVCGLFLTYKGSPPDNNTAAAQITPASGDQATDVYIDTRKGRLKYLTQGEILHEAMHNLTGLEDFVSAADRTMFPFQPPYDLKTLLGIEPVPGVDPASGPTIDITNILQNKGCAGSN